jgi:hypothetical protein
MALALLTASDGRAISDYNRPEITRLWVSTDEGDKFACTGTYIQPYISDYGSWLVSAGHCTIATLTARNQSETVRGVLNWRGMVNTHGEYGTQTIDIALATVPDVRDVHKRIWLADQTPDEGRAYIHGFPAGIEEVDMGYIAPERAAERVSALFQDGSEGFPRIIRKSLKDLLPGLRFMMVKHARVVGGSSGSPILDGNDRLVGILWGVIPYSEQAEFQGIPSALDGYDIVLFTPVERVHELFKSLGVV